MWWSVFGTCIFSFLYHLFQWFSAIIQVWHSVLKLSETGRLDDICVWRLAACCKHMYSLVLYSVSCSGSLLKYCLSVKQFGSGWDAELLGVSSRSKLFAYDILVNCKDWRAWNLCLLLFIFSSAVFRRKKVEVLSSLWCRRWQRRSRCRRCRRRRFVVVTNFNLGYNFVSVEANFMKLHMLVHHHKGYNLTKDHNSARLCGKIMPLYRYGKWIVYWLQECQ